MKIIIQNENLKKGLAVTERLTEKNISLPILNNVLISGEKNFILLSSTNLEIGIKWWNLAKIEKPGKVTVPAKLLSRFVSLLPNQKICLEKKNKDLYISCANYSNLIKGLDPEEFPIIPSVKNEDFIEINNSKLIQGLSQVVEIASPSSTRPEISGVYFIFQKKIIKLVATDSFRLAEKTLTNNKEIDKECSFILSKKTVYELINIFSEENGNIKIYFSPNHILFETPMQEISSHAKIQIISRLIEGEYPNYQDIIPNEFKTQAVLKRDDFINQIKTASLFTGKLHEIKLRIDPKKNGIEISCQNPDLGEHKSLLNGKIDGEKFEISFNYRFLLDGLLNIKSPEIVFGLNGEEAPAVLKPRDDQSYIYVVMPIKGS